VMVRGAPAPIDGGAAGLLAWLGLGLDVEEGVVVVLSHVEKKSSGADRVGVLVPRGVSSKPST
jgi:hypothetical protein